MKEVVVSTEAQSERYLARKVLINSFVFLVCMISFFFMKNAFFVLLYFGLYLVYVLYEYISFKYFTYNKLLFTDQYLEVSRKTIKRKVVYNNIKFIKEIKDGIEIILKNRKKYKVLGDVINPNVANDDYLQKNIVVAEVEKRAGMVIEYKKRNKDL